MKLKIILNIILILMIAYDFLLHLADMFKWDYSKWGPGVLFPEGSFVWGSVNYTYFWVLFWGIVLIILLIILILSLLENKK